MKKVALVTCVTGQDGIYLANLFNDKRATRSMRQLEIRIGLHWIRKLLLS